ncbi:MAG: helix-turn-helix domain-containing protein [Myxococcales bacterium]|nr:MAG: helix-turn-helix domain-containing protein [Myxococcales bacterium]
MLEEVAEETRTALSTVRHWIATGRLPSTRPGRRRLVRRADLERFLADSTGWPRKGMGGAVDAAVVSDPRQSELPWVAAPGREE